MSERHTFVLMIKEKWWKEFRNHQNQGKETHSYVRRGVAPPKKASLIIFYVTKPAGEIAGYAEFIERRVGDADNVWNELRNESVLSSKEKFQEFIGDEQKVSFIRFRNLHEAAKPIELNTVLMLLGKERLQRKGFYIDKEITDKMIALME